MRAAGMKATARRRLDRARHLALHHDTLALRLDRNPPSLQAMEVSTTQSQAVRYTLLNLPHYLCPFLGEIITRKAKPLD